MFRSKFIGSVLESEALKEGLKRPLKQGELAQMLGYTPTAISQWFRKERGVPIEVYLWAFRRFAWTEKELVEIILQDNFEKVLEIEEKLKSFDVKKINE